jgi:broad specificity phosphatase PhoE
MARDSIGGVLLYLVRHCLVDLDEEERIRGTQNVPLNDEGEEESAEVADFFRDLPISAIYSDDLDRTYHTAIAIAKEKDLPVKKDIRLRSWDVGSDLEGKSIDANHLEIRKLKMQPQLIPIGGESWGVYERRAEKTLERYTRIALDSPAPIILVIHGSLVQLLWNLMGQNNNSHAYDDTPIEPSGIIAVYLARNGYQTRILREAKEALDA